MPNGPEQIEARLAAYIDGELPDHERGEIEHYLSANPGHRQIVEELRGQKLQLRSLPREHAPVEVLDHLQSHLERQALLRDVDDDATTMQINRWPQWTAVAAMLLLTAGLGYLVVQVLPGGGLNREEVAIAPAPLQQLPAAPSLDEDLKADRDAFERARAMEEGLASKDGRSATREPGVASKGGPGITQEIAPERRGDDFVDRAANDIAKRTDQEMEALALSNGNAIVVSTDDPLITQNLLAGYLGQNYYEFKPVPAELAMRSNEVADTQNQAPVEGAEQKQALSDVVAKVNQREKFEPEEAAYLLVRNVSPEQAEDINSLLNTQRSGRQQARVYFNRDLYPEFQQPTQSAAVQSAAVQSKAEYGKASPRVGKAAGDTISPPSAGAKQAPAPDDPTPGGPTPGDAAGTDQSRLPEQVAANVEPRPAGGQPDAAPQAPATTQQALAAENSSDANQTTEDRGTSITGQTLQQQAAQSGNGQRAFRDEAGQKTDLLIVVRSGAPAGQWQRQELRPNEMSPSQTDEPGAGTVMPTTQPQQEEADGAQRLSEPPTTAPATPVQPATPTQPPMSSTPGPATLPAGAR